MGCGASGASTVSKVPPAACSDNPEEGSKAPEEVKNVDLNPGDVQTSSPSAAQQQVNDNAANPNSGEEAVASDGKKNITGPAVLEATDAQQPCDEKSRDARLLGDTSVSSASASASASAATEVRAAPEVVKSVPGAIEEPHSTAPVAVNASAGTNQPSSASGQLVSGGSDEPADLSGVGSTEFGKDYSESQAARIRDKFDKSRKSKSDASESAGGAEGDGRAKSMTADEAMQILNAAKEVGMFTGAGALDFEEFLGAMGKPDMTSELVGSLSFQGDDGDLCLSSFEVFDRNGDGFLCAEEMREVLEAWGEPHDSEAVAKRIKVADMDGDGRLSFAEFKMLMKTIGS